MNHLAWRNQGGLQGGGEPGPLRRDVCQVEKGEFCQAGFDIRQILT